MKGKKLILATLIAAAGAYTAAGEIFFKKAATRDPRKVHSETPYYLMSRPWVDWWNKQQLEPISIVSCDGLTLWGNILRQKRSSRGLAVVVHGHESISGQMGFASDFFYRQGFDVFAPDLRAHGQSEGRYYGMGLLDSGDLIDWLDELLRIFGSETPVLLYGVSMGAATVLTATGDERLPANVRCAVSDCGYADINTVFALELAREYPRLPAGAVLSAADLVCRRRAGYSFKDVRPIDSVARSTTPTLFIHGDDDPTVPFYMLDRLYESCPAPRYRLAGPGARHAVAFFADQPRYEAAILELAERYMV